MKDIDFDELDKAVNSLMGSVPADTDAEERPKVQSLTVPTTLSGDDRPLSYSAIEQAAARIGGETIVKRQEATEISSEGTVATTAFTVAESDPRDAQLEPVATTPETEPSSTLEPRTAVVRPSQQRRGQFMDVFHASSDMKQRVNRAAEPIDPVGSRADQMVKQDEVLPGSQKVSHEAPVLAPIEDDTSTTVPRASDADTSEVPDATALEPSELPEANLPITTPFLPDAKVKKRPLGAASQSSAFPDEASAPAHVDLQLAAPVPQEHVPDEFQGDVMAIELAGTPEADLLPDEPAQQPTAVVEEAPEEVGATPTPAETAGAPALPVEEHDDTPDTTVSDQPVIVSQPQPVTEGPDIATTTPEAPLSEDGTGAIYDTTEYHAPVAHPAKQSNWRWVILIIVVIVIGAAGGAVLYLMTSAQ